MRYIPLDKLALEMLRIKTPVSPAINIGRTNVFSGNYQILLAAQTPLKKNHIRQLYAIGTTLASDGAGDAVFLLFRFVEIRDWSLALRVQKDGFCPRKQQTAG